MLIGVVVIVIKWHWSSSLGCGLFSCWC